MKVMIVDDSPTVRRLIKSVLEKEGVEIVECTDGKEAIESFSIHWPDLVLMDLEMKHVDGFEATRQIKAKFPDAQIVILTSFSDENMKAAALASGANAYLLKDDMEQLRALVKPPLDGNQAQ